MTEEFIKYRDNLRKKSEKPLNDMAIANQYAIERIKEKGESPTFGKIYEEMQKFAPEYARTLESVKNALERRV